MNGWYISGYADGESYFIARPLIRTTKKGLITVSFSFRWGIQVRADDAEILYKIKDFLDDEEKGIGFIYERKRKGDVSPQITLHYDGVKGLMGVREHFEKYPLIGKKKNDFKAWAKAYDEVTKAMRDPRFSYRYFGDYPEDVLEQRIYLTSLCDHLRLVRLNSTSEMRDIPKRELLRKESGQPKLYTEQLLEKLIGCGKIKVEQYDYFLSKYGLKI